jgi:hypothetical protein
MACLKVEMEPDGQSSLVNVTKLPNSPLWRTTKLVLLGLTRVKNPFVHNFIQKFTHLNNVKTSLYITTSIIIMTNVISLHNTNIKNTNSQDVGTQNSLSYKP